MAEFEDNEELAGLIRWWSRNARSVIVGLIIGLIAVGGWYGWHWYRHRQDAQAADMFAKVQHAISTQNVTGGVKHLVDKLKSDYSGTPYAGAAALRLAAYDVGQQHLKEAASQLDWAMEHAEGKGMRSIARARKARVLWAEKKPKAALALLNQNHPAAFNALYAELAGDIQAAEGDVAAAHKSYKTALDSLPPNTPSQLLQRKLKQTAADSTDSKKADS